MSDHGHHAPSHAPKASSNSGGGGNDPLAEGSFGLSFGFMAVLAGFVASIIMGRH